MENDTCPRCGSRRLKRWPELTEEQQMLAKRLPASVEYRPKDREEHLFCTRCWFEDDVRDIRTA